MTQRVLFLCTGNSARSQLAEAIFRHLTGDNFIVQSAGTQPSEIDPRVFTVLEEKSIDANQLTNTRLDEVKDVHFDYVITLCDKANQECALFSDTNALLHWDLVDPKPIKGKQVFIDTFNDLKDRIALFVMLNEIPSDKIVSAIELFKIMSDPLRLKILMLLEDETALTVSDMTTVLDASQPKVSRHLALLRDGGILQDKRQGLWIFYQFAEQLPVWVKHVLTTVRNGNPTIINQEKLALNALANRKRLP